LDAIRQGSQRRERTQDDKDGTMSPVRVRPLGGTAGCLGMILFSIIASVVLTLLVNAVLR
jgi:hypothetical protein